jgi:subtilisin family serine protease
MKSNFRKPEIATAIIIALLLTSTLSALNVDGVSAIQKTILGQGSQETPEQKISQYLKDQIGQSSTSRIRPFRVLIKYSPNMKLNLPKGMKILKEFKEIPLISALASSFEIEELAKLEGVERVYPDMKVHALTDDPGLRLRPNNLKISDMQNAPLATEPIPQTPWFGEYPCFLNESTTLIKANNLWADGINGTGVIIAILDTGINKYHPDLDDLDDDPSTCDPKILAEQTFIEEPLWEVGDPMDYHGHGTHVASIAAGTGDTGAMGYFGTYFGSNIFNATILPGTERGVAPGAYLYNVKVLNNEGWGYDSWIVAGIEWAMDHGVDVISMSLGGWPVVRPEEDPLALALDVATKHGVVCVVAAGNDGWGYFSVGSPGFAPQVITAGATTETDKLADFSSRGPEQYELHAKPDILAPGTCIVAAFAGFDEVEDRDGMQVFYWEISGTSMATPHVAGAAALLLQAFPGATPYAVKNAMMLSADDLGLDPLAQGAGRLNVAKALEVMTAAPKEDRSVAVPANTITPMQLTHTALPNLTNVDILVENSFCNPWKMSVFINILVSAGANVVFGSAPYSNNSLVNPVTGQPIYDIFILSEPNVVDETLLPPSVLGYYVRQNGTVLFTGDKPKVCKDYTNWTKQWGVSWNNTAVGGFSTNIASHVITNGVKEIYFGSPIDSLILDTTTDPSPQCVVWDPILPGVAVWETRTPSTGKVVVISDDAVLSDQYLQTSDNLVLGFSIIRWFTNALDMFAVESELIPPVESEHPYPANADILVSLTAPPGSNWISVHFAKIDVEYTFDSIMVYDMLMRPVEYFTGYYEDVWTVPVQGNMLWIRLRSDSIVQNWGFLADAIRFGNIAPMIHEIGLGATWEKYVMANSTFTVSVDAQNFGNYTENVMLNMTLFNSTGGTVIDNWNFRNVTVTPGETTTFGVAPAAILNATTRCDFSGPHDYKFSIIGTIYNSSSGSPPYRELYLDNNIVKGQVSAVPKTARTGSNPLLSTVTPMKITSDSAPLITRYPKDFTLHNVTAFVSGGTLENARFRITGTVTQIAGFVDLTEFTYHALMNVPPDILPDPSPAYFKPNATAIVSDTLDLGNVTAPTMLSAGLQVYIAENTAPGTYSGRIELFNGTTVLASSSLNFEVRPRSKYKILWEDYYNDYFNEWKDCERLWGGSNWGLGLFEWWKLASQAGFDIDSLHQQTYLDHHVGALGTNTTDPLGIIAYGGYNALYLHDCDFYFRPSEISVFRQLYETGKMDFAVLFESSELNEFTSYYGINATSASFDLVIDKFDKTHPIFNGVNNFTLMVGPTLKVGSPVANSVTKGIAVGTGDFGVGPEGGFVVAVNEMHATSHLTSRMVAVADSNTFEYLEYSDFMLWVYTWLYTGEGVLGHTDTAEFAINLLQWLDPQLANDPPVVDYFDAAPTTPKLGETVSVDTIVHDPDGDDFNVTVAVRWPNSSWTNTTVTPVGGHWLSSFTTSLEGSYKIYVVAVDSYGGTTEMLGATIQAVNMPPEIVSASVSSHSVIQGETVFISVNAKDMEDVVPASIRLSVVTPDGSSYVYNFLNVPFASVSFNTSSMVAGIYGVNVTVRDSDGAQITANVGSFEVKMPVNHSPKIVSHSISPDKVIVGEAVFITVGCEDAEDSVPANITVTVTFPNGTTTAQTFSGMALASLAFDTANQPKGIYQVTVTAEDSEGASTTAIIGNFEVKPAPAAEFPIREATLGIGVIGLILLAVVMLLIFMRLPGKPEPVPASAST